MWRARMRRETESGQAGRRAGGQWSRIATVLRRIVGAPELFWRCAVTARAASASSPSWSSCERVVRAKGPHRALLLSGL